MNQNTKRTKTPTHKHTNAPTKRQTWVKRRYASTREFVYPVLDALKQNKMPDLSHARSTVLPALESARILTVALDEELELINSTSQQDADQLVVQLAIKRNAFAIFTQDTDYLMYQYPNYIHYLSVEHFHWKKLFNGSKDLCTKCMLFNLSG